MTAIRLVATATFGLEAIVARELKKLGYEDIQTENGRLFFTAPIEAIARCNLWLRSSDRILVCLSQFPATSFEELFEGTKALPWADWLPPDANFPVEGKSIKSKLFSVPDCQAIVKKAIVEKLKASYPVTWFPETGPRYTVEVALFNDVATLTLDTSGAGLHKRGYRQLTSQAPLKETLAAALISLSFWNPERVLADPFCGSGTIPIEAALIGLNIAPGLKRSFAAENWPITAQKVWSEAREEARDLIRTDTRLQIRGTDIDNQVLSLARHHAREAGVADHIHWQQMPMSQLSSSYSYGCIICNPPYGQRLEDMSTVKTLYREMGQVFTHLDTWSYYILTSHQDFEHWFGRQADRRRKLFNGRLECQYYQYYGPRPPRREHLDDQAAE
ncbi:MAG: THUMP domain-containing class I SAM-dependent RNA methyltransferase [Methylocystaceae bacterium]